MHSLQSFQRSVMDIYERPLFRARVTPKFPEGALFLSKRGVVRPRPQLAVAPPPPWPFNPLA